MLPSRALILLLQNSPLVPYTTLFRSVTAAGGVRRLGVLREVEASHLGFLDLSQHRSEEHTSELQSHSDLVCRLLLEKNKLKLAVCEALFLCTLVPGLNKVCRDIDSQH